MKWRLAFLLFLAFCNWDALAESKGWLVIEGGSNPLNPVVAARFRELVGDSASDILIVPTAASDEQILAEEFDGLERAAGQLGIKHYKMLHTRDRERANSEAFVAPIRKARGVWFGGGRPGRIAEAYVGTRVQKELQALYDRGGVIGGSSAGAMILGSFLVRGGVSDEEFHQLLSPTNQTGLGFFKNVVIDSHVNQRHGEGDLAQIVAERPGLLGIGIDAGTAIVVHGGPGFEVIGGPDARVVITDGKQHDGKPYYFLKLGDRLN